jgi:predicted nucleic acid-binding protein
MSLKKVYLDTSVISALFDSRTPERKSLTKLMWQNLKEYDVYISEIVMEEISLVSDELKTSFTAAVDKFTILTLTDEIENLAMEYVKQGIFPQKYYDDALHVAFASVNRIDYLLSWNFKHLVKVKTRRLVALLNSLKEYQPVEIIAPPEL